MVVRTGSRPDDNDNADDEVKVYHFTSGQLNGITWHTVGMSLDTSVNTSTTAVDISVQVGSVLCHANWVKPSFVIVDIWAL